MYAVTTISCDASSDTTVTGGMGVHACLYDAPGVVPQGVKVTCALRLSALSPWQDAVVLANQGLQAQVAAVRAQIESGQANLDW